MAKKAKESPPVEPTTTAENKTKLTEKIGISPDSLRKLFDKEPSQQDDKIKALVDLIRSRIKDGRMRSLRNWKTYAAIDAAFNVPFSQIAPTIAQKLGSPTAFKSAEDLIGELKNWDVSKTLLFNEQLVDGKVVDVLDPTPLFEVTIPLVAAYTKARASKLFNDRNSMPLFTYDPVWSTAENRVLGECITQIMSKMTSQYGYQSTLRSAIMHALKYSYAMIFPKESWHYETDEDTEGDVFNAKEGLRYSIPHPTRCAFDPMFSPSSINTDTGCEWSLYWDIKRYGEVTGPSSLYWNKERITYGINWFDPAVSGASNYFAEYWPTTMTPPVALDAWKMMNENDRIAHAARFYAAQSDKDKAVFETTLFMKLRPSDWGLGDWKHNVWFRFVVLNDDAVVWAEPIPFNPNLFIGYDSDDGMAENPSLSLEVLPWQHLTSNILRQHITTVRQNLLKVIAYDPNQIEKSDLNAINGRQIQSMFWLPVDQRKSMAEQNQIENAFKRIEFGQQDTVQILTVLNNMFNLMERALAMSAQEVGSISGHVQTAEEIRSVSQNTSNRAQFTGSYVDDFIDAWKKQLWEATKWFMDEEFAVEVTETPQELTDKLSKELGFKFGDAYDGKVKVQGEKSKIVVEGFLSQRENLTRQNYPQIAQVMLQAVDRVAQSPLLSERLGPEWIAAAYERAFEYLGAPKDFELRIPQNNTTLAMMKQVQAQLNEAAKQIAEAAAQQAQAGVGGALQQTQQAVVEQAKMNQTQAEEIAKLNEAVGNIVQMLQTPPAPEPPPVNPMEQQPLPVGMA